MRRFVLASGSARRADVLRQLGLSFDVRVSDIDESALAGETPETMAKRLAHSKVRATRRDVDEIVIGADTLVVLDGQVLGKPECPKQAVRMLLELSGRSHTVVTGLAVARGGRIESLTDTTTVWFRSLAPAECRKYVATGEPLDKAGAYGIQGLGAALVRRVDGDFYNVMGLPVYRLLELLRRFDVEYDFGEMEIT